MLQSISVLFTHLITNLSLIDPLLNQMELVLEPLKDSLQSSHLILSTVDLGQIREHGVHLLVGQHFVGVCDSPFFNSTVVLLEFAVEKFELVFCLDEGVGSERNIESVTSGLDFIDEGFVVLPGLLDNVLLCYW